MATAVKCTICGAEEWWRHRHNSYELAGENLNECVNHYVGLSLFNGTTYACINHEPELAARLLQIEGVA